MKKRVIFRTVSVVIVLNLFTFLAIAFYNPPYCLLTSPYPGAQGGIDLQKECYMWWMGGWEFVGNEWDCSGIGQGCYETYCDIYNPDCSAWPY